MGSTSVSPAWQCRDLTDLSTCQERIDAFSLGKRLAEAIVGVHKSSQQSVRDGLEHRFGRYRLEGQCLREQPKVCAARTPMIGAAMVGGAPDGRSQLHDLGWREGVLGRDTPDQGPKRPAFDFGFVPANSPIGITRFILDILSGPRKLPLGIYRVGDIVLGTIPGEFTTFMGLEAEWSLRKTLEAEGVPVERVLLVGLANEYVSYFATPKEYQLQYYEGASTAYGPVSGQVLTDLLASLAEQFGQQPGAKPERITYRPGLSARFGLWNVPLGAMSSGERRRIIQDDAGTPLQDPPKFCWNDVMAKLPWPYRPNVRVTPRVSIETRSDDGRWGPLVIDGVPQEDEGVEFVTTGRAVLIDRAEWCAEWLDRDATASDLRFRVESIGGRTLVSPPFTHTRRAF